jgi:acyl-coenzyme A synthetase/AMP-(fatty) acid ligase
VAIATTRRVGGSLRLDFTTPAWARRRRTLGRDRMRLNYATFVDRIVDLYGSRTAFVLDQPISYPGFSGETLSFLDVGRLVNRMAHALRELGVRRGDRVGMVTVNRVEMAFCNFAAAKLGAIPVPMNFMLRPNEIEHIVRTAGAEVLLCDRTVFDNTIRDRASVPSAKTWALVGEEEPPPGLESLRDLMRKAPDGIDPVHPATEDEPALLFFTSGTTGFPKGATLSHTAAMVGIRHHARFDAMRPRMPRRLSLLVLPVAHAGGYAALVLQLAMGTPTVFISRFRPEGVLDAIERYRPTMFAGSPAMYRMLLDAGAGRRDLSSIRVWGGGADAFTDDLVGTFRALTKRHGSRVKPWFVRGYGMAEANSYVAQTPPFECGDNCIGFVMPPVRFRVVDEDCRDVPRGEPGELILSGPTITTGYWNDPEATAAAIRDGWFHTSDLVRQGKWRMLYFVGRSNDIIKSGGYKIAAAEIDRLLMQHPAVQNAAAVGLPDPVKGERPFAAVVLRPGSATTAEDLLAWTRERLAPYKCPRAIIVVAALPLTISLKPKRREVAEMITAVLADAGGDE